MTLEEIAAALGVPTPAEVAAALGLDERDIRAVRDEPCLVLDFRGEEGARRWERMAKPPIAKIVLRAGLDPFTGLRKVRKTKRRKRS